MNNLQGTSSFVQPILMETSRIVNSILSTLIVLGFLLIFTGHIQAQTPLDQCSTTGGPNAIGFITYNQGLQGLDQPIYIRIYVHAVGYNSQYDGAPSAEQIKESIDFLHRDFAEYNIHFVWDCEINWVNSSDIYDADVSSLCSIINSQDISTRLHSDGIDIFISGDDAPWLANAIDIPGSWLIVKGSYTGFESCIDDEGGMPVQWVASRSHTFSHEMGHCLGLWHTHHGVEIGWTNCDGVLVDSSACEEFVEGNWINGLECGDYVDDTPADGGLNPCWASMIDSCKGNGLAEDSTEKPFQPDPSLIMSYAHNKCYRRFSEGQGARMHQIILSESVLLDRLAVADFTNMEITSNQQWTTSNPVAGGDIFIKGDLTIASGYTLSIQSGVTVHFGTESRLIIEEGGRLNLQGTLTGAGCSGNTWKGVVVSGTGNGQSQYSQNGSNAQGIISCGPGSIIENAEIGIQLYGLNQYYSGGIAHCQGNIIRNCTRGVEFAAFENFWPFAFPSGQQGQPKNYNSYFKNTVFINDQAYPHLIPFDAFVRMAGVNGVTFTSCSFTNSQVLAFLEESDEQINDWGYGIWANDAGFNVLAECSISVPNNTPCPSYIKSSFSGLGYGIYSATLQNNRPYQVRQAEFDHCIVGIRHARVSGATLLHNEFSFGEVPTGSHLSPQTGIYFEGDISGFTVQENTFIDQDGPDTLNTIGIFSSNTGDFNKEIRRNTFTGLTTGNQTMKKNGNAGLVAAGLNFLCNVNQQVAALVGADFDVATGRVRSKQGLPIDLGHNAAGNRFSYTGTDFQNSGDGSIEYFYYPSGVNQTPQNIVGDVSTSIANENGCLEDYCIPPCLEPGDGNQFRNTYYTEKTNYLSASAEYVVNPSDSLLNLMAYRRYQMDHAAYALVVDIMYDTITYQMDSLLTWVEHMDCQTGDLWLAGLAMHRGDTSQAYALVEDMDLTYDLTLEEEDDMADYRNILGLMAGKDLYQLDSLTVDTLLTYDESDGYSGTLARSILTLYGAHYPPDYPEVAGLRSTDANKNTKVLSNQAVHVYPNPSTGNVIFTFPTTKVGNAHRIRIVDMSGRLLVQTEIPLDTERFIWNTDDLPGGLYYYQVLMDGTNSQSGKLVLSK